MTERIRVGVIGCGLIAQVMHLHYLRELSDRFEIAALCDLSTEVREACGREYGVARLFEDWHDLVDAPVDAVMVLTSGSHAPAAIAAANAGKHVFVEKPMCFSVAEGAEMVAAAERAGVTLMVGYNKRYDPAYVRLVPEARGLDDLRLLRITTLESPIPPYVHQYNLVRGAALPASLVEELTADSASRVKAALGDVDELSLWAYRNVLLDTLVHELNAMRGVLGEPDALEFADMRESGLTAVFTYGRTQVVLAWVDLPNIARYEMEFAFYTPDRRLTLSFPSPFLRSMPTLLVDERGTGGGSPESSRTEQVTSYQESFREELIHFHECISEGRTPRTSGRDTLHDIAMCKSIVDAHRSRARVVRPSEPQLSAAR